MMSYRRSSTASVAICHRSVPSLDRTRYPVSAIECKRWLADHGRAALETDGRKNAIDSRAAGDICRGVGGAVYGHPRINRPNELGDKMVTLSAVSAVVAVCVPLIVNFLSRMRQENLSGRSRTLARAYEREERQFVFAEKLEAMGLPDEAARSRYDGLFAFYRVRVLWNYRQSNPAQFVAAFAGGLAVLVGVGVALLAPRSLLASIISASLVCVATVAYLAWGWFAFREIQRTKPRIEALVADFASACGVRVLR